MFFSGSVSGSMACFRFSFVSNLFSHTMSSCIPQKATKSSRIELKLKKRRRTKKEKKVIENICVTRRTQMLKKEEMPSSIQSACCLVRKRKETKIDSDDARRHLRSIEVVVVVHICVFVRVSSSFLSPDLQEGERERQTGSFAFLDNQTKKTGI